MRNANTGVGLLGCAGWLLSASLAAGAIPASERTALIAFYTSTGGPSWTHDTGWLGAPGTECSWYGVTCDAGETTVTALSLSQNQLTGAIPPEIGALANLGVLELWFNQLSGPLPAQIGDLPNLATLRLDGNQLNGPIPAQIGNLANLEHLDLGGNRLSGPIPPEIGNLPEVAYIDLALNELTGPIPPEIGDLTTLVDLRLSQNHLSGPIPSALGNLAQLEYVTIDCNRLVGEIPTSLTNLTSLVDNGGIILSYNGLWTDDPSLNAFLDAKQWDGLSWKVEQAIAPTGVATSAPVQAAATGTFWVSLSWTPIAYQPDNSHYQVWASDTPGGPYSRLLASSEARNASAASATVGPLEPGTTTYLVVRTAAYQASNDNVVLSDPSDEVVVVTTPASTYHVAPDGDDGNDCLAEDTACATIQAAVDKASSGDVVEVAAGTYLESVTLAKDLVLRGAGAWQTLVDGEGVTSTLTVGPNLRVVVEGLTLTGGDASLGGGVYVDSGALAWFVDCEVRDNLGGGGVYGNAAEILVDGATIANNIGPGVWQSGGSVVLSNATVSGNAASGADPGGLLVDGGATLENVTVTQNTSDAVGGVSAVLGLARFFNTVIAGNSGPQCSYVFPDSRLDSMGHNLDDDGSCRLGHGSGDISGVDPLLGPLTDNGGRTRTHRPQTDSPLIDAGEHDAAPATDQRGLERPWRDTFDIGAVEVLPTDTFADVPAGYWADRYVEGLVAAGITAGCGGGDYCPEAAVSRAQMAVFLLKGEHGKSWMPPDATGIFGDVPTDYWAADWIEALAAEGITAGCGGGDYCPETDVSRAQMAVFLLKTEHGTAWVPPEATGIFDDVPIDYWAADWIEALAGEGITAGCGNGDYCPETTVARDQMAVFLVKTFRLPR